MFSVNLREVKIMGVWNILNSFVLAGKDDKEVNIFLMEISVIEEKKIGLCVR